MTTSTEDLTNQTLNILKNSELSEEDKTKLARDLIVSLSENDENKGVKVISDLWDYVKSSFLPTYGLVVGVKKITNDEVIPGVICILINLASTLITIYYLAKLLTLA
ncbi:MAG: hypothetical protein ACYDBX_03030 [Patescibacteria group bacterium]|jgi:hypothetical protein